MAVATPPLRNPDTDRTNNKGAPKGAFAAMRLVAGARNHLGNPSGVAGFPDDDLIAQVKVVAGARSDLRNLFNAYDLTGVEKPKKQPSRGAKCPAP